MDDNVLPKNGIQLTNMTILIKYIYICWLLRWYAFPLSVLEMDWQSLLLPTVSLALQEEMAETDAMISQDLLV